MSVKSIKKVIKQPKKSEVAKRKETRVALMAQSLEDAISLEPFGNLKEFAYMDQSTFSKMFIKMYDVALPCDI